MPTPNFVSPHVLLHHSTFSYIPIHPTSPLQHQSVSTPQSPRCIQKLTTTPVKPSSPSKPSRIFPKILPLKFRKLPKPPSKAGEVHVAGDSLESTPLQRLLVTFFFSTIGIAFSTLLHKFNTPQEAFQLFLGTLFGFLFADFGTGCYHFAVDNYGSEKTPIFGYQIAAFQGHHKSPWTITQRPFSNNIYRLTIPTTPQVLGVLALGDTLPIGFASFWVSSLMFIVLSQEFHKWAHMTTCGPTVSFFQNLGLIIAKKDHGKHHASPFGEKYCIVSGTFNRWLDDSSFFRRLEKIIYRRWGVEPISWKLDKRLKEKALSL